MEVDLSAAARAVEFTKAVANNLVTVHAGFLLGFIAGATGLRRRWPGTWSGGAYLGFVAGVTGVLLLAILVVGLRLDLSEWALFAFGLVAATIAWLMSGGLPPKARVLLARVALAIRSAASAAMHRVLRPRIPDRLPPELRILTVRRP